jgi:hypothetical protein
MVRLLMVLEVCVVDGWLIDAMRWLDVVHLTHSHDTAENTERELNR